MAKKTKSLGEAAVDFVQGGNQAQTFILIVIVGVVALFLLSSVPKLIDKLTGGDKNNNGGTPTPNPNNNNVPPFPNNPAPDIPTPKVEDYIPSNKTEQIKIIQRLLKSLGYNLGAYGPAADGIDGDAGSLTNNALRSFSSSTGKGQFGVTSYADWIRILRAHTGRTGLSGLGQKAKKIMLL